MKKPSKLQGVVFITLGIVSAGPAALFLCAKALFSINNLIGEVRDGSGHTYSIQYMNSAGEPQTIAYLMLGGILGAALVIIGIKKLNNKMPNQAL